MDEGIIAALKSLYRRRLFIRIFDNIDTGAKPVYNMDILTAMHWMQEDWNSLKAETVVNSSRHCSYKCSGPVYRREIIVENMTSAAREHRVRYSLVEIKNLLNLLDEDDVVAGIDLQSQAIFITSADDVEITNDDSLKDS